jgi:hypothetical protein
MAADQNADQKKAPKGLVQAAALRDRIVAGSGQAGPGNVQLFNDLHVAAQALVDELTE